MTLDEFKATLLEDIDAFVINHKKGHEENPEVWPLEMDEGDWFDQFLISMSGGTLGMSDEDFENDRFA